MQFIGIQSRDTVKRSLHIKENADEKNNAKKSPNPFTRTGAALRPRIKIKGKRTDDKSKIQARIDK